MNLSSKHKVHTHEYALYVYTAISMVTTINYPMLYKMLPGVNTMKRFNVVMELLLHCLREILIALIPVAFTTRLWVQIALQDIKLVVTWFSKFSEGCESFSMLVP